MMLFLDILLLTNGVDDDNDLRGWKVSKVRVVTNASVRLDPSNVIIEAIHNRYGSTKAARWLEHCLGMLFLQYSFVPRRNREVTVNRCVLALIMVQNIMNVDGTPALSMLMQKPLRFLFNTDTDRL